MSSPVSNKFPLPFFEENFGGFSALGIFPNGQLNLRRRQEAQRRFCHCGPHASLNDFKKWLCAASHLADEAAARRVPPDFFDAWVVREGIFVNR